MSRARSTHETTPPSQYHPNLHPHLQPLPASTPHLHPLARAVGAPLLAEGVLVPMAEAEGVLVPMAVVVVADMAVPVAEGVLVPPRIPV